MQPPAGEARGAPVEPVIVRPPMPMTPAQPVMPGRAVGREERGEDGRKQRPTDPGEGRINPGRQRAD
jgi:hypothetical protein